MCLPLKLQDKAGSRFRASGDFVQARSSGVESAERRVAARWTNPKRDQERVELAFATVELRSTCENRRRATIVLGPEAARELTQRLADLAAFATVAELADLFPNEITDRSPTERALCLQAGHDLVFCAGHVEVPMNDEGGTDWTKVSRIRIVALEARNG